MQSQSTFRSRMLSLQSARASWRNYLPPFQIPSQSRSRSLWNVAQPNPGFPCQFFLTILHFRDARFFPIRASVATEIFLEFCLCNEGWIRLFHDKIRSESSWPNFLCTLPNSFPVARDEITHPWCWISSKSRTRSSRNSALYNPGRKSDAHNSSPPKS